MARIEQWIGINGCKRWLDGHLRPQGTSFRVGHNDRGIQELGTQLPLCDEWFILDNSELEYQFVAEDVLNQPPTVYDQEIWSQISRGSND